MIGGREHRIFVNIHEYNGPMPFSYIKVYTPVAHYM